MTYKSHLASTLPIAYFAHDVLFHGDDASIHQKIIFIVIACFASLLADIDEPHSYIGVRYSPLSHLIRAFAFLLGLFGNKTLAHRGLFHSLFIPILVFTVGFFVHSDVLRLVLFAIATGLLSHVCEDMITNHGVALLSPFSSRRYVLLPSALRFSTGGFFEMYIYFPSICLFIVYLFFGIGK